MVKEEGRDTYLLAVKLLKNVVSVIRAVVITDARVIPTHNEMCAPVVFAYQRVEDGFTRASVAHGSGQHREQSTRCRVVVL